LGAVGLDEDQALVNDNKQNYIRGIKKTSIRHTLQMLVLTCFGGQKGKRDREFVGDASKRACVQLSAA
jgi:hypothetical protein